VLDANRQNTYAGARYVDQNGEVRTLVANSDAAGHAEANMISRLAELGVNSSQVTDLYVEFEPCGACMRNAIPQFSQANVTWSFPWSTSRVVQLQSQLDKAAAIREF
jgi:tRNA(Arg) A34 adenosine deaminase TadA